MRIYEVVSNLANNAISAIKDGKVIVSIKVIKCAKDNLHANNNEYANNSNKDDSTENKKMCAVVSIADNGMGSNEVINLLSE